MWPFGLRLGGQDPVEKYRRWLKKWFLEGNSQDQARGFQEKAVSLCFTVGFVDQSGIL